MLILFRFSKLDSEADEWPESIQSFQGRFGASLTHCYITIYREPIKVTSPYIESPLKKEPSLTGLSGETRGVQQRYRSLSTAASFS